MADLKIPVINKEGKIQGEEKASGEVFGLELNPVLISQTVKKYLAKQRKSRAKAKTRAEVSGSTAKIWRQKGTGRARHGSRKANLFVGGGVVHGPTGLQNYSQRLNKKMGKKAVWSLLSEKLRRKNIFIVEDLTVKRTKEADSFLDEVIKNLSLKGKIALVLESSEEIKKFFGNLGNLDLLNINNLNAYELLRADNVLLSRKALEFLNRPNVSEKNVEKKEVTRKKVDKKVGKMREEKETKRVTEVKKSVKKK